MNPSWTGFASTIYARSRRNLTLISIQSTAIVMHAQGYYHKYNNNDQVQMDTAYNLLQYLFEFHIVKQCLDTHTRTHQLPYAVAPPLSIINADLEQL